VTVPLRVRLALVFAGSFAALLVVGAVLLYWQFRRQLLTDFDRGIHASAETARLLFQVDLPEQGTPEATVVHILTELAYGDRTLVAFDSTGRRLATTGAASGRRQFADALADAPVDHPRTVVLAAGRARVLGVPLQGGVRLVLAMSLATVERQLEELREILLALLPGVLLVGGTLGGWGAGFVLRPVNRVAVMADEVGRAAQAGEIAFSRLPDRPGHDELGTVTQAFNRLLDRTSAAIGKERRVAGELRSFLADAAHELRTPVAIIRNEAEVALSSGEGLAEKEAALRAIDDEATRLGELVADLLFLARGTEASPETGWERVFLDDLANQAVGRIRKLKEAAGRSIEWGRCDAAAVRGAGSLLERAIVILIHNALTHAPGSPIEIATGADAGRSWVRVRDFGPGVPAADRDRIFHRFVRLATDGPGTGLGLPIARAIAVQHHGELVLETDGPGASFLLSLPTDRASQA
jgi:signal transduction histidine kinase